MLPVFTRLPIEHLSSPHACNLKNLYAHCRLTLQTHGSAHFYILSLPPGPSVLSHSCGGPLGITGCTAGAGTSGGPPALGEN